MMLPTHISVGLAISTIVFQLAPDNTEILIAASILGSTLPDLDIILKHRKSLHYPIYGVLATALASVAYIIFPSLYTLSTVVFLLSFSLHPLLDIVGGGLSKHPWNESNLPSVYNHYTDSWISESKLSVNYDGSPYDFAILLTSALYIYQYTPKNNYLTAITITLLIIGSIYAAIRKKLPVLEETLYNKTPALRPFLDSLHKNNK